MISYDLVIFDCDGVLVESERIVNRLEAQLITEIGLPMDEARARALFKSKTVGETAQLIEELLGGPLPPAWLYDWGFEVAALFVRELKAVPGVVDVVHALARASVPLCVASQSPPPRIALALQLTGLAGYFTGRMYSAAMVKHPKPAPDLFLHAAAQMRVDPARCVVIEDSASGVIAARAAGMDVFGYAGDEDAQVLSAAGASVFTAMKELPALLGSFSDER